MCTVVKHRGDVAAYLAESVLVDDGECQAGRTYVLLRTTVDEGILAYIHRAAEDIRRHIRDQGNRAVDVVPDLRAVDSVVRGDMEIIYVSGDFEAFGDIAESLVGAGCESIGVTQTFGFLEGFLAHTPVSR